MRNKRGELGDVIGLEETIFLILNIAFFFIILTFAYNAGSRAFVYEESYAKQIVNIIDNGKPGINVLLDVSEGIEIGKKNGISNFFNVFNKGNRIEVRFSKGGYSYQYFSDYEIELKLQGNKLLIILMERKDG
jgi:hypothetical protein